MSNVASLYEPVTMTMLQRQILCGVLSSSPPINIGLTRKRSQLFAALLADDWSDWDTIAGQKLEDHKALKEIKLKKTDIAYAREVIEQILEPERGAKVGINLNLNGAISFLMLSLYEAMGDILGVEK